MLASDRTEDELIKEGVEKRRAGEDAAALDLFRLAYELKHSPRAVGQMGLAEMALGRWLNAETHLQEALTAAQDPWIKKNSRALEASQVSVREHLGNLEVLGSPEGAEVIVEGEVA